MLVENTNRILPLLNLALLLALIFLAYLFIVKAEERKAEKESQSLVLFVVEDKAFKRLLHGISSKVENAFYSLKRLFGCVRSKLESMRRVELLLWCKVFNMMNSIALEMV